MTAKIIRIRNDAARISLLILIWPGLLFGFAIGLLVNQPKRFFTREPWKLCVAMWWAVGLGLFVDNTGESDE